MGERSGGMTEHPSTVTQHRVYCFSYEITDAVPFSQFPCVRGEIQEERFAGLRDHRCYFSARDRHHISVKLDDPNDGFRREFATAH
jgi:hypothetical protein